MSSPLLEPRSGGQRRLDRVLSDDYLDGLAELPIDGVRALRHDAEQEEADLSYLRRLLQGRMDLIRAEQTGRASNNEASIVERLSDVLADDATRASHGSGRHITVEPSRVAEHRRRVEALVADVGISDVAARTDAELSAALAELGRHEEQVSKLRHQVQAVMDTCTAEIGRRYREGEVDVSAVLGG